MHTRQVLSYLLAQSYVKALLCAHSWYAHEVYLLLVVAR